MSLSIPGENNTRWMLARADLEHYEKIKGSGIIRKDTKVYSLNKLQRVFLERIGNGNQSNVHVLFNLHPKAVVMVKDENGTYNPATVEEIYIRESALGKDFKKDPLVPADIVVRISWIYSTEQARNTGVGKTDTGEALKAGSFYTSNHIQDISAFAIERNENRIPIQGQIRF